MGRTTRKLLAGLALVAGITIFSASLLHAESTEHGVPVSDLLEETGTELSWDPYRGIGTFRKGTDYVTARVGGEGVLVNYSRLEPVTGLLRKDGRLLASGAMANVLREAFGTEARGARGPRVAAIVIDPGHGGKDPGAIGRYTADGTSYVVEEKDVVLSVGVELRERLAAQYPGREILITRDTDTYLSLEERTEVANRITASQNETVLFISLHANASFNREASGFEVWYLPPDYRRDGLVEPDQVGVEDPELLTILNRIKEEEFTVGSIMLARRVLRSLDARLGDVTVNRGLKEESWYVVRNAKMPSILVEVGFVTNREEALRLKDESYLNRLADGIYTGVVSFIRNFEE